MKYLKKDGKHLIHNGPAIIRVEPRFEMDSPVFQKSRRVQVFEVAEIVRPSFTNQIPVGAFLAMSFPKDWPNRGEYEWSKNGKWEEMMVPFTIKDRKPKEVHKELPRKPVKL